MIFLKGFRFLQEKVSAFFFFTEKKKLTKTLKKPKTQHLKTAFLPGLDLRRVRRVLQEQGGSGGGDRLRRNGNGRNKIKNKRRRSSLPSRCPPLRFPPFFIAHSSSEELRVEKRGARERHQ